MMLQRRLIYKALVAFAGEAVPMRWIRANGKGQRPPRPYGTILLSSFDPIGFGETDEELDEDQIRETMTDVIEISASFQAYGKTALDDIWAVQAHAKRPSVDIGDPSSVLLGFMDASTVRDLTEVVSASQEHRAQIDLRFSARFSVERLIDTVRSVAISSAYSNQVVEVPEA